MSGHADKDLVERCRRGEDDAWRDFVDRFGQKVYSVAYHFTLKREDAEELAQEIFLKVFENLHRGPEGLGVPAILYVNGCGAVLEKMALSGANVLSIDWRMDLADATHSFKASGLRPGGTEGE